MSARKAYSWRDWLRVAGVARWWTLCGVVFLSCGCAAGSDPAMPEIREGNSSWGSSESQAGTESVRTQLERVPLRFETGDVVSSGPLTLEGALRIAFRMNPTFEIYVARRDAARGEWIAALAWRNPDLELQYGYAMSREVPGARGDTYGVRVEQEVELPWKRIARGQAAALGIEGIEHETESFRIELGREVTRAYYALTYQEDLLTQLTRMAEIVDRMKGVVQRRLDAGEAPPIDLTRIRLESLKAQRLADAQRQRVAAARIALNTLCGNTLPEEYVLADTLNNLRDPSLGLDSLEFAVEEHPDLAGLWTARRRAETELRSERADRYPDPRPGVGFARETDEDVVSVSLGLEIPLWSHNRGAIARAEAEIRRIDAEIADAENRIRGEIARARQDYAAARELLSSSTDVRALAVEALEMETFLYEQGEVDLLAYLESARTYQETELEYIHTVYETALAGADLVAALGTTYLGGIVR